MNIYINFGTTVSTIMDKIVKLESVVQFNAKRGQETLHPLVSVLDQSKSIPIEANRYVSELYIIF